MPSSRFEQLNEIMALIYATNPKSILDIGVGFGKYGFLAREYLEIFPGGTKFSTNWKRRIDGIEVFNQYLTPIHEFVYDKIYVGDAVKILPTIETNYDLILLIDVLEHFDYVDGKKILSECMKKGKNLLISTPLDIGNQEDVFGNVFETHKFQWEKKHFDNFTKKFFIPNKYSLICFIGKNMAKVKKEFFENFSKLKKFDELREESKKTVEELYKEILHRPADKEGLITFCSLLEIGKINVDEIKEILSESLEKRVSKV